MNRGRSTVTPASNAAPTPVTPSAPSVVELEEPERECSDEEDFELLIGFDPENAKQRLYNMSNSIQLTIR
jgi:hypothetical protein